MPPLRTNDSSTTNSSPTNDDPGIGQGDRGSGKGIGQGDRGSGKGIGDGVALRLWAAAQQITKDDHNPEDQDREAIALGEGLEHDGALDLGVALEASTHGHIRTAGRLSAHQSVLRVPIVRQVILKDGFWVLLENVKDHRHVVRKAHEPELELVGLEREVDRFIRVAQSERGVHKIAV